MPAILSSSIQMQTGIAFNVVREQAKRIANPNGIRPGDADKSKPQSRNKRHFVSEICG